MDYEVYWSGSLDRQGLAPHSSGYLGRSSLFICESRAPKETIPARLHEDERRLASVKRYQQTEHGRKAAQQRYSQTTHGKTARANAKRAWQARKAEQQPLFGEA